MLWVWEKRGTVVCDIGVLWQFVMETFYLNKNLCKKDDNMCDGIVFVCLCQNSEIYKVKFCCSTCSLQWFVYLHDCIH